jgi:hypothetical protein
VLNKVVTHGLLQSFGVPTPPFYGLLNRVDGQTFDGHPLRSVDDLARLIQRTSLDDVCLKPVGGWGGKGFLRVRLERGDPVRAARGDGGDLMTLGEFWSTHIYGDGGASYLCQGAVQQHPDLAALHPESVNTARVWMCQPRRGEWRMYEAILRMGVGSMIVDNTSSGGITSRIDLKSGVLASALDMTAERIVSDRHPTTGVQLTGRVLPMWEDVGKLCLRACRAFPYLRLMGLDVAFGRESPLIIEVESSPGWDHQITFDHGVAPLLRELAVAGRFDWRA